MARNVRTYGHFCTLARAMELVGDRWTLLVVRDLLTGPKRFTDLMDRLAGITPKTLVTRLRELADNGMVSEDREQGRREVIYALTTAGAELAPAVDALAWWGVRHAWRPPVAGEPLHAEHLLRAIAQVLDHTATDREHATWLLRVHGDGEFVIACDGRNWTIATSLGNERADVTVDAPTAASIVELATDPRPERAGALGVALAGSEAAVARFLGLLRGFLDTFSR